MKSGYIQIGGGLELYFEASGNGEIPILLLPGWTMSTQAFERQFKHFSQSNDFRFIALDPRAHGRSANTEDGHFYEQHGRDLHAFIESQKLDKLALGSWSCGTLATLSYVQQFGSDRLAGFVMLDSPPRAAGDNQNDWVTYTCNDNDGAQEFFTLGKLRDKRAEEFNSVLEDFLHSI